MRVILPTASGLERGLHCAASIHLPAIDSTTAASDRGTWRHRFLARIGQVGAEAALAEVPEEHRAACEALPLADLPVDLAAEVAFVYNVTTGTARAIGTGLDRAYGELAPGEIAGSADVVGIADDGRALVLDWKSVGHRDHARDSVQLRFLALAAARAYDADPVQVEIVRLGDGGEVWRSRHTYDTLDLAAFAAELREWHARVATDRTPVTGPWCQHCKSFQFCGAQSRLAVQVAEGRVLSDEDALLPLTPERAGVAWRRIEAAETFLARVKRAVLACLDENGGNLPLPEGRWLVKRTVPGNEKIDGPTAFAVLAELHGAEIARAAVEMKATKTGLRNALRAVSLRHGELGRNEECALRTIRERGGASRGTTTSIEEVDQLEGEVTP